MTRDLCQVGTYLIKKFIYLDYIDIIMIQFETKLKRWGKSFGVVIPMEKIKIANISENELLEIKVNKKQNPLKKHFGSFKFSKPIKEILKESDEESWDE